MKTTFTKQYIMDNRGCYSEEKVNGIKCINNKTITLKQLFRDIPIADFCWLLIKKTHLTLTEKREFAIHCAEFVLPIFEKENPKDDRPRKAIEEAKKSIKNETKKTKKLLLPLMMLMLLMLLMLLILLLMLLMLMLLMLLMLLILLLMLLLLMLLMLLLMMLLMMLLLFMLLLMLMILLMLPRITENTYLNLLNN